MRSTEINETYSFLSFINFTIPFFIFRIFIKIWKTTFYIYHILSFAFNDSPWEREKGTKLFGIVLGLEA